MGCAAGLEPGGRTELSRAQAGLRFRPPRAPLTGVSAPGSAAPPPSLRHVVLPVEHGGWAFLLEPILLGLLLASSGAGLLIAVAALAGYVARQPLRLFVMDRRRGKRYPRTALAERAFAACALAGALALAAAVWLAPHAFLLPLALATPLAALSLALDLGRRAREAAAEVSGALALGATAAAIALAGGWRTAPALALWAILAARTLPTVLYVRARLRLDRGEPAGIAAALAAHAVALVLVATLAVLGLAPWMAAGAIALLALRAAHGLSPLRPALRTAWLGISELTFGLVTVLATAWGFARGF